MPEAHRPDDEVVSAVLDGEATPAERARVAADPQLAARLAEFAAAAELVSAPVTAPSPAARDRAVAGAVAEGRRGGGVRELRRPRRDHRGLLGVAAVVVAVLAVAGLLVNQGRNGGNDLADESAGQAEVAESGGDAADEALSADSAEDGATAPDEPALGPEGTVDLGAVADDEELRRALAASGLVTGLETGPPASTTPTRGVPEADDPQAASRADCLRRLQRADPTLVGPASEATVTYAGRPATVFVFTAIDGPARVVVVPLDGCVPLTTFRT